MTFLRRSTQKVRIIGGQWRGRQISFPNIDTLRPSPDRVRETLFNWLAPLITGARCLDLFAGSGALGFEALSRGASHVVMVDHAPEVIAQLKVNAALLHATQVDFILDAFPFTKINTGVPFDIVFLDPPYHQNMIAPCCEWLVTQSLLAPHGYVYIEAEQSLSPLPLPPHWQILRSKKAGQVGYHLVTLPVDAGI